MLSEALISYTSIFIYGFLKGSSSLLGKENDYCEKSDKINRSRIYSELQRKFIKEYLSAKLADYETLHPEGLGDAYLKNPKLPHNLGCLRSLKRVLLKIVSNNNSIKSQKDNTEKTFDYLKNITHSDQKNDNINTEELYKCLRTYYLNYFFKDINKESIDYIFQKSNILAKKDFDSKSTELFINTCTIKLNDKSSRKPKKRIFRNLITSFDIEKRFGADQQQSKNPIFLDCLKVQMKLLFPDNVSGAKAYPEQIIKIKEFLGEHDKYYSSLEKAIDITNKLFSYAASLTSALLKGTHFLGYSLGKIVMDPIIATTKEACSWATGSKIAGVKDTQFSKLFDNIIERSVKALGVGYYIIHQSSKIGLMVLLPSMYYYATNCIWPCNNDPAKEQVNENLGLIIWSAIRESFYKNNFISINSICWVAGASIINNIGSKIFDASTRDTPEQISSKPILKCDDNIQKPKKTIFYEFFVNSFKATKTVLKEVCKLISEAFQKADDEMYRKNEKIAITIKGPGIIELGHFKVLTGNPKDAPYNQTLKLSSKEAAYKTFPEETAKIEQIFGKIDALSAIFYYVLDKFFGFILESLGSSFSSKSSVNMVPQSSRKINTACDAAIQTCETNSHRKLSINTSDNEVDSEETHKSTPGECKYPTASSSQGSISRIATTTPSQPLPYSRYVAKFYRSGHDSAFGSIS
jgi:hypothetical protein